jgi:hypothetical protein
VRPAIGMSMAAPVSSIRRTINPLFGLGWSKWAPWRITVNLRPLRKLGTASEKA